MFILNYSTTFDILESLKGGRRLEKDGGRLLKNKN
jgi:hypothetical protein